MVDINAILDSVRKAVQENALFGDLLTSEDREFLMKNGLVRTAPKGTVLCKQAQRDQRVFIIITGSVDVTETLNGKKIILGQLGTGEIFGEIGALFMTPRIATVTTTKDSVLLEIPGGILEELINSSDSIRDAVYKRYRERTLRTALRSVVIFSHLNDDAINSLSDEASLLTARKGEVILKEGEQGDAMYIIRSGQVRVYISTMGGRELNLALLYSGDYFGEQAMLTGAPRTASVAALEHVEAVRIGRAEFLKFIQDNDSVRERIDSVARERTEKSEAARYMPETAEAIDKVLQSINDILNGE
ncbi:MAG: hypothetical protein BMS9Abin26_0521 [Gammaproteobacteria bacterium]|nr:MAG: hypothetical protein BMS9Abin26_0521 [Gammaproteobacteria bacterium]